MGYPPYYGYPPGPDNWGAYVPPTTGLPPNLVIRDNEADNQWFDVPNYVAEARYGITELHPWVLNQQPAHISALADQFSKAQTLLAELESTIRQHSQALFAEAWTKSEARAAFMEKGPGLALAYLGQWKERMALNESALRSLIEPIHRSQNEMVTLWDQYQAAKNAAKTLTDDEYSDAVHPIFLDEINPFTYFDNSAQATQAKIDALRDVKEEYDLKARQLVDRLGGAYEDAFWNMSIAVGSPYSPPNVVMANPGKKLSLPSVPSIAAPGFGQNAPPGAPAVAAPPPPPVVNPASLTAAAPPPAPVVPPPPVVQNVPGNLPGGPGVNPGVLPPPPPGFNKSLNTAPPPGLVAPGVQAGALPGTTAPPGFGNLTPPGAGLAKGVLRNPGAGAGLSMVPPPAANLGRRRQAAGGSTLRSPAGFNAAGGPGGTVGSPGANGLMPPPGAPASRRQGTTGGPTVRARGATGVPPAFSQSPVSPVAPVLGRPSARARSDAARPTVGPTRGGFAPPSATPPVLGASPARGSAGQPPAPGRMPPLPGGMPPGRRPDTRAGRGRPNLTGNPNWLAETGPGGSASTAPVLRNQVQAGPGTGTGAAGMLPARPGATAPVLGRSREAVRQALAESRARSGQPVETELARRGRETDHQGRPVAETAPVRAGEEAFTLPTPGGSVVGNAGPAQPAPAPRPTIGHG